MQTVEYTGQADVRVITAATLAAAGISSPDLVWNKANGYEVDVDDLTAAFLLAADNTFKVDSNLTFGGLVYGADKGRFESLGAIIPQTSAVTEKNRWLAHVRDDAEATPSQNTFHYIGGDVTDGIKTSNDSVIWIHADHAANTAGNDALDADDTYPAGFNFLSFLRRTGVTTEALPGGTFTGQVHRAGTSGEWMSPQLDGGQAANLVWWPLTIIEDAGGILRVFTILNDPFGGGSFGVNLDSHIITLTAFITYSSVTPFNFGGNAGIATISAARRADGFVYTIHDENITPPGDSFLLGGYTKLKDQYVRHRLGRIADNDVLNVAGYQFWNGSTWVSGIQNAVPIVDEFGAEIRGPLCPYKTPAGHWIMAAKAMVDSHLSVYRADAITGPWRMIARIPVQFQGKKYAGGTRASLHTKILPWIAAPADHSIAMFTNMNFEQTGPWENVHIKHSTPEFVVIPWY